MISPVFSSIESTIARDSKCVCFLKKSPPGWNPFSITTPAPTSSAPESLTNFASPSKALPFARKSSIRSTLSPFPRNSLETIMSYTLPCVNDSTFVVYTSPAIFLVCVFLANTTGTSSADRIEGMIKNTIYGIIAAKTCGIANPTVGILNVDGARQTEKALKKLQENGYPIEFAESGRADGGCVMRGNDVLQESPDIMVTDSLTGNIMVKMLSSFTTGGSFEATGFGYGPGIGEGYEQLVMIVSRASGAPVIANAIRYAAQLVRGKVFEVAKEEFAAVKKAGLKEILDEHKASQKPAAAEEEVKEPPKEVVTAQIPGIEVMDLEDAVKVLWKLGIYAESGMGCTGPIIRVSDANLAKAEEELKKSGYIN